MRHFFLALVLALAPLPAMAAELLLFEANGCYWCDRWKSEVGRYYHKTREGQVMPLRIVSLDRPMPADLSWLRGVRASPTFVLVDEGYELGRIVGYRNEDRFWMRVGKLLGGR